MHRQSILIIAAVLYFFFEAFMNLRQKKKTKALNVHDKNSLRVIYLSIATGYFLSFSAASIKTEMIDRKNLLFIIGAVLFISGLIIRISSLLTLKKYFSYTVSTLQNHKLIETRLYKTIRHPGYLGQLILFFGFSVALSNWLSILAMMIPVLAGYRTESEPRKHLWLARWEPHISTIKNGPTD